MADLHTPHDELMMRHALALAAQTRGATRPNPPVGCVLTDAAGNVIGEGWHHRAGMPHAEVEALRDCARRGHDPRGGTAYVTLEPCNHHGRTGPCSEALIGAGLARVVIAARDPNAKARGGMARLAEAGIRVTDGLLAQESFDQAAPFMITHSLGRPMVTLKWAMTLDGCTASATGHSHWITGDAARQEVHRRRAQHDAILVGIGTALRDRPRLTVRLPEGDGIPRFPLHRIILDRHLRIPDDAPVLDVEPLAPTTIVCGTGASAQRSSALAERGVRVLSAADDLNTLLSQLRADGIQSVYIEGGRTVAGSFLAAGCVDRIEAWIAPRILGGGGQLALSPVIMPRVPQLMSEALALRAQTVGLYGEDVLIEGWLKR